MTVTLHRDVIQPRMSMQHTLAANDIFLSYDWLLRSITSALKQINTWSSTYHGSSDSRIGDGLLLRRGRKSKKSLILQRYGIDYEFKAKSLSFSQKLYHDLNTCVPISPLLPIKMRSPSDNVRAKCLAHKQNSWQKEKPWLHVLRSVAKHAGSC